MGSHKFWDEFPIRVKFWTPYCIVLSGMENSEILENRFKPRPFGFINFRIDFFVVKLLKEVFSSVVLDVQALHGNS